LEREKISPKVLKWFFLLLYIEDIFEKRKGQPKRAENGFFLSLYIV